MYIHRVVEPEIKSSLNRGCITAILGPRRVGKTSLVEHLLGKMHDVKSCLINLDNRLARDRIRKLELGNLIAEGCRQNIGGEFKLWVAIDEAQKCPELFDQIKIIYDEWKGTDKIKFIITGSAHLTLHQLTAETLAGRIELFYMQPFTLREHAAKYVDNLPIDSLLNVIDTTPAASLPQAIANQIEKIKPFADVLQKSLNELLNWGGLPELTEMQDVAEKQRYLQNYIDTYLEQDIRKINTITDLNLYKNLMDITAQQTGSLRDDTRLLSVLGCGRDTLKKYRGYLQATLMYIEIFPYISTTINKVVKSPKAYMLDNGIISNLTGIYDLDALAKSGLIGNRFENWFLQELRAWVALHVVRSEVYFWRLTTGAEIDFVVSTKPNVYPFEITFGTRPERKKIATIKRFLNEQPDIAWAFYIYNGVYNVDNENRIIYIPAWCI